MASTTLALPTRRPQDRPINLPEEPLARNRLFERLKQRSDFDIAAKPRSPITVSLNLDDGHVRELSATAWSTTPEHLLQELSEEKATEVIVASVDGTLWDLTRPFEKDSSLAYHTMHDSEGRAVCWHSAAHILGEAAEHEYECLLSHGPSTATGFFYDMAIPANRAVSQADWPSLEARVRAFVKTEQPFERLKVSKENLRELFQYSKYKLHFIEPTVPDTGISTVYRSGSLVDLCARPHISNTKLVTSFKVMGNSAAYFLSDQKNDSLQRISGVAFSKDDMMIDWEKRLAEAAGRDHQNIGTSQKLFWFSQLSPGSPFFLPHGTRIFSSIQTMLREQYWERGYEESGHWQHYQDDMFRIGMDATETASRDRDNAAPCSLSDKDRGLFALKPMNCPGHALMFASEDRSYRDLPWRVADFSVLHRNEASGALSGLTRVRKFQQDDAHIFCTLQQVTSEIHGMFDFMTEVYGMFGFPFKLKLSTRPESYMGTLEELDTAEEQLKQTLRAFRGDDWVLNIGDGAFYGPKIDATVNDAMGRQFQCATIQLDFQLPQKFKLRYRTDGDIAIISGTQEPRGQLLPHGMARPVMIHRAVSGPFERFMAMIMEHFGGN